MAAFFAIMTKVGAYAILRVYVLIFGGGAGAAAWLAEPWVLPAAAVTLLVGMIGVVASRTMTALAVYALVGSVGTFAAGYVASLVWPREGETARADLAA